MECWDFEQISGLFQAEEEGILAGFRLTTTQKRMKFAKKTLLLALCQQTLFNNIYVLSPYPKEMDSFTYLVNLKPTKVP